MLGAIIGDIIGSRFEFNNHKSKDFDLFTDDCFVTDDSIMTLAVAKAIMETEKAIEPPLGFCNFNFEYFQLLNKNTIKYMQQIGRNYPGCGYGGMFAKWIKSDSPEPYSSYGNGAAMRISPAGFAARTEREAIELSECITSVSHNHEEGQKGAEATAVAIYLARQGYLKSEICRIINDRYYALDFFIDEIRDTYEFNETCQQTVPQAIECFLESTSFEDAIRTAISLGGDSDTLAAITGAIAQAYYGIPDKIRDTALNYLNDELRRIYDEWVEFTGEDSAKFKFLTKYISKIEEVNSHKKWVFDKENDRAQELPIPWLYIMYIELVDEFIKEFHQYFACHPEYGLDKYRDILRENGIAAINEEITAAEARDMDGQCILAHIMYVIRSERCYDGKLIKLFGNGCVLVWLKRLRDIDWQSAQRKLSEIYFQAGGYGGFNEYRVVFTNEKAVLTQNKHFNTLHKHKRYSVLQTKELRAVWNDLHTEYWSHVYKPASYEIDDGTNWFLFVCYEGMRGLVFTGENAYPGNWESMLKIFDIDFEEDQDDNSVRKPGQLIYCSVSFNEYGEGYYYQTEDEELEVGDTVIVPAGVNNEEKTGVIEKIEYFDSDLVPYPLEKTKHIISKASAEEKKEEKNKEYVIYSGTMNNISVHVWAEIKDGCLLISGQDLGVPHEFFDGEHEYFYSFDRDNTLRFSETLTRQTEDLDKFLSVLVKKIKGPGWYDELMFFCKQHSLKYSMFGC